LIALARYRLNFLPQSAICQVCLTAHFGSSGWDDIGWRLLPATTLCGKTSATLVVKDGGEYARLIRVRAEFNDGDGNSSFLVK
jgi:hypothetical protein